MDAKYIVCLLWIIATGLPLPAQGPSENKNQGDIIFTPYLSFAELDGNITLRGRIGDVEASFSDIWGNQNIGLMGRLEGWVDPMVGGRLTWVLSEKWSAAIRGTSADSGLAMPRI